MIQLRCTKKVQDFLGVKKDDLRDVSDSNCVLGSWYVNIFLQERRNVIIFMNEKTLLSFILTGVKKHKAAETIKAFPTALEQLLTIEGFSKELILPIIQENRDIEFTATNSRGLLGNMNDLIFMYQSSLDHDGGLASCDTGRIIQKINRTPQRVLQWEDSISVVTKIAVKPRPTGYLFITSPETLGSQGN